MAGNKALQKFKDSKIPKKGTGKVIIEVPIYREPNTQSVIIGKIPKDQEITWISKSVCDEREWIRTDQNDFGYIIGYEKDGKCNLDIGSIKEKKEETKKEWNFDIKVNENIPITKEEINYGNLALKEILDDDDKKEDKDNESNTTGVDEGNKSGFSLLGDDENKSTEIKIEEENWDNLLEGDMSKFDLVENENNKLISEILCKLDEENNQAKKENETTSINNNENQDNGKENEDNSVSQALDSIKDVLPGNEKLSEKEKLFDILNSIPGGKKEKKEKNDKKEKKKKETVVKDGKVHPKNYATEGANFNQALKDAKRLNNIPKNDYPTKIEENKDKRGKHQPGKVYTYKEIKDGETKEIKFRDDCEGHDFGDDKLPPHINDESGRHFFYEGGGKIGNLPKNTKK